MLYSVLAQYVVGIEWNVLRTLPVGKGFRSWQELCRRHEPRHPGRYCAQLTELLNPSWQCAGGSFLDKLKQWEKDWADYELATGETIPESLRCAVVLKHAPLEIRDVLRRSTMDVMASYATLKDVLEAYRIRSLAFQPKDDGGPQPMEVDAFGRWKAAGKQPQSTWFSGHCLKCRKVGHKKQSRLLTTFASVREARTAETAQHSR